MIINHRDRCETQFVLLLVASELPAADYLVEIFATAEMASID